MRRKRYVPALGVAVSRAIAKEMKRAAADGRSDGCVVVQVCLLAGVPPLRLPEGDEGKEGAVQKVLGGYDRLVEAVRGRLEAKLGGERAQLEMLGSAVFEMQAVGSALAPQDLPDCYTSLAPMLGKSYPQQSLDALSRLQCPAESIDFETFLWLFMSGPMAEHELPAGWWQATEPAQPVEVTRYGVLQNKTGVAVEYSLPYWDPRTVLITRHPAAALDEEEVIELINTRTAFLLTAAQRDALVGKLRAAGEWETVEVEADEVDPNNPTWSALKNGPDGLNLNKVPDTLLDQFKEKMDEGFKEAVIAPDDPGYKYDSRAEFSGAKEENEWDDSDDE